MAKERAEFIPEQYTEAAKLLEAAIAAQQAD
jgi:hypothetical protein